ncbi:MAG: hypothetical protein AAF468_17735 [Pseudomonadota bacterium]
MKHSLAESSRSNGCYFERTPEMLVLEGYRHWSCGFQTGSITPWEMAWSLYTKELGAVGGRKALGDLSSHIRTLRKCATCPLRPFPYRSQHLNTQEALNMGLIAGLQHDDAAADLCLDNLTCKGLCDEVADAARAFAQTLLDLDQVMLPIPKPVIQDILQRSNPGTLH